MSISTLISSNSSNRTILITRVQGDIIDDETMHVLRLVLMYVIQIVLKAFGVGMNVLSIIIFVKCGLSDSVSIAFLALSVSDLGYLAVFIVVRFFGMFSRIVKVETDLPLGVFAYILSFYAVYFQDVSALITIFTAVQKCCCVALPHLFKNVFTVSRAWFCIGIIYVAMLAYYIPLFSSFRIGYEFSAISNETRLTVSRRRYHFQMMDIWRVFSRVIIFISSQVILLICLFIMLTKFKQSAKFRKSFVADDNKESESQDKNIANRESVKLGVKERRALSAVVIVSAMYVVSTFPYTVLYFVILTYPPYQDKHLTNTRILISNCQSILVALSASLNFFVYFHYNSRFHATFRSMFRYKASSDLEKRDFTTSTK